MKLIMIAAIAALSLIGCGKGQEIQLLSENNSHVLYLYPEHGSAELYTGMSLIADYKLSVDKKIFKLTPKTGKTGKLELALSPKTGNWACRGCRNSGLSSQWIQQ